MCRLWVAWLLWWSVCGCGAETGARVRAALAAGGAFSLQSTVLLNSAERRDRELGYRIEAELGVAPAPAPAPDPDQQPGDVLLRFTLSDARLMVRGAHRSSEWTPRESVWDAQRGAASAWYARLRHDGQLDGLLLDPSDPADVRDYKRAVASLFQFQCGAVGGGEHNETDSVGTCEVSYEALGAAAVRKIKRRCAGDGAAGAQARRAARLSLAAGGAALHALHAEEVLTLHGALKARSWHALERAGDAPPAPPPPPALRPHALPLEAAAADPDEEDEDAHAELGVALREHRAALTGDEPGAGGTVRAARALLRLLPALQRATQRALHDALEHVARDELAGLCRALGLAGTAAAARAAADFTRLREADPLEPLARSFLAGLALAPEPRAETVLHALRLAGEARRPALADAALLAVAAAAGAHGVERGAVREAVTRGLARCRDPECRAVRLHALGNLRADAADLLVESAEREAPRAAAAALAALRAAPALRDAHLARLGRLAVNGSLPLEVRAAALELVVRRRAAGALHAAPLQVVRLAEALHAERSRAAHELRRVLWQRLETLREAPPVRALLPLLPRALRTWDARAHAGTSHVLRRETGWGGGGGGGAGGWRARLDSVQLAAGGLLRRGNVALLLKGPAAAAPDSDSVPELEVEVWTRGLEALAGAEPEGGDPEPEPAAGGLALSVGGARLPDITLFNGQAELLGHVWAGTGSTPTGVLRALRPARCSRAVLPLLAGCALRVRTRAATALALDAHAAVSLWHRTARGALALRAGLAAETEARVRLAWGELHASRDLAAEPRLRIALALDFYDSVALCVRAAVPAHALHDELRLRGVLGARRLNVTRGVRARRSVPPRTMALGRANDAACRTLQPEDDDDQQ